MRTSTFMAWRVTFKVAAPANSHRTRRLTSVHELHFCGPTQNGLCRVSPERPQAAQAATGCYRPALPSLSSCPRAVSQQSPAPHHAVTSAKSKAAPTPRPNPDATSPARVRRLLSRLEYPFRKTRV